MSISSPRSHGFGLRPLMFARRRTFLRLWACHSRCLPALGAGSPLMHKKRTLRLCLHRTLTWPFRNVRFAVRHSPPLSSAVTLLLSSRRRPGGQHLALLVLSAHGHQGGISFPCRKKGSIILYATNGETSCFNKTISRAAIQIRRRCSCKSPLTQATIFIIGVFRKPMESLIHNFRILPMFI